MLPLLDAAGVMEPQSNLTLPAQTLSATAVAGNIAAGAVTLPKLTLDAYYFQNNTLAGDCALLPQLDGSMNKVVLAPIFTGLAISTRDNGETNYSNVPFNSYVTFSGTQLAENACSMWCISLMPPARPLDGAIAGDSASRHTGPASEALSAALTRDMTGMGQGVVVKASRT